jgi:hypothetical protein
MSAFSSHPIYFPSVWCVLVLAFCVIKPKVKAAEKSVSKCDRPVQENFRLGVRKDTHTHIYIHKSYLFSHVKYELDFFFFIFIFILLFLCLIIIFCLRLCIFIIIFKTHTIFFLAGQGHQLPQFCGLCG